MDNSTLGGNQTFTKCWGMNNTGSTTWSPGSYYGTKTSGASFWPSTATLQATTAPGSQGRLCITFTTPNASASYAVQYVMAGPSGTFSTAQWFGVSVGVSTSSTDAATYAGTSAESPPMDNSTLGGNQTFTKCWGMNNTGSTTWSPGSYYGTKTSGASFWPSTATLQATTTPGGQGRLCITFTTPNTSASYAVQYVMAGPSGTFSTAQWFGLSVGVSATSTDAATYAGRSYETGPTDSTSGPATLQASTAYQKCWGMTNSGTTTWTPSSYYGSQTSSYSWAPPKAALQATTSPGQVGTLCINFTSPSSGSGNLTYVMASPNGTFSTLQWFGLNFTVGAAVPTPWPTGQVFLPHSVPWKSQWQWDTSKQTWDGGDDCGPASLAMVLGYYGIDMSVSSAGSYVRNNAQPSAPAYSPTWFWFDYPGQKDQTGALVQPTASSSQALLGTFGVQLQKVTSLQDLKSQINAGHPVLVELWNAYYIRYDLGYGRYIPYPTTQSLSPSDSPPYWPGGHGFQADHIVVVTGYNDMGDGYIYFNDPLAVKSFDQNGADPEVGKNFWTTQAAFQAAVLNNTVSPGQWWAAAAVPGSGGIGGPQPTSTPQPQPTSTPQPQPTSTPQPQPTSTPQPQPTSTPQPQPTSTPQPQPTSTPQPSSTPTATTLGTVFEDFSAGISRWATSGSVTAVQAVGNTFMRISPAAQGSAEASRDTTGVSLSSYTAIEVRVNLNGATLLDGDASALYLNQGGWRYVSLSRYVAQGSSQWQVVRIPLSDFSGFNQAATFSNLGFRFWLPVAGSIDVDDIRFIGASTPQPTSTPQPQPTSTPQPQTSSTPTPTAARQLFDDFAQGLTNWGVIGSVAAAQQSGNTFMRFTPPVQGSAEAWRPTSSLSLASVQSISLRVNLNGATLLDNDASALYLDQGGWKYVSLSRYVTQGSTQWQTITIPLTAFTGFAPNSSFDRLGFRFWVPSASTIDVDDIWLNL